MAQFAHALPVMAAELLAWRRAARRPGPQCQGLQARLFLARQVAARPEAHTAQEIKFACQTIALHSENDLEREMATEVLTSMTERAA